MGPFFALGGFVLLIAVGALGVAWEKNPNFKKWLSDQKKGRPINLLYLALVLIGSSFAVASFITMIVASSASSAGATVQDKTFAAYFGLMALSALLAGGGWFGIKNGGRLAKNGREHEFYKACVDHGIRSADSRANLAKMRLLAEKAGIRVPEGEDALKEFFLRGKAAADKQKQKIAQIDLSSEIKKEREEERREYVSLIAFTDYSGRSKRKCMLSAALDEAREALKNEKEMERCMGSLYQTESSWGTAGGIASGIAGPAAGVAAAIDTMQKNAEKRAYNASIAPGVTYAQQQIDTAKLSTAQAIELYKRQIEETDLKLIDETVTEKDVFSKITVHDSGLEVSKTGAVRVWATVSAPPMKILGSAPGVVDGYLLAIIRRDGKKVGEAKLRLPMYGLSAKKEKLNGICTSLQDPEAKYAVELSCGKLWIIERA